MSDFIELETNIDFNPFDFGMEIFTVGQYSSRSVFEILSLLKLNKEYVLDYGSNVRGTELSFLFKDAKELISANNGWGQDHLISYFLRDLSSGNMADKVRRIECSEEKANRSFLDLSEFSYTSDFFEFIKGVKGNE